MAEKKTANITSHTFQRFVKYQLLSEFYFEKAVRTRAQSAAVAEKMNETDVKELEDVCDVEGGVRRHFTFYCDRHFYL